MYRIRAWIWITRHLTHISKVTPISCATSLLLYSINFHFFPISACLQMKSNACFILNKKHLWLYWINHWLMWTLTMHYKLTFLLRTFNFANSRLTNKFWKSCWYKDSTTRRKKPDKYCNWLSTLALRKCWKSQKDCNLIKQTRNQIVAACRS